MWFVRQIGKNRFEASELKSANDLECYDNYIDAAVRAKELQSQYSLEKYKEHTSDKYRLSHLLETDSTELEKDINSYSEKKRKERNANDHRLFKGNK